MNRVTIKYFILFFFALNFLNTTAQQHSNRISANSNPHPKSFTISKTVFDQLFFLKTGDQLLNKTNKYLQGASLLMNTTNGDMKFLRLKLRYFENAFLMIQVNGTASTQVFIQSEDKSVFYKGRFDKETLVMDKCQENEILSE
jgi:hypothetical protein